jgi:hypothetical protein
MGKKNRKKGGGSGSKKHVQQTTSNKHVQNKTTTTAHEDNNDYERHNNAVEHDDDDNNDDDEQQKMEATTMPSPPPLEEESVFEPAKVATPPDAKTADLVQFKEETNAKQDEEEKNKDHPHDESNPQELQLQQQQQPAAPKEEIKQTDVVTAQPAPNEEEPGLQLLREDENEAADSGWGWLHTSIETEGTNNVSAETNDNAVAPKAQEENATPRKRRKHRRQYSTPSVDLLDLARKKEESVLARKKKEESVLARKKEEDDGMRYIRFARDVLPN